MDRVKEYLLVTINKQKSSLGIFVIKLQTVNPPVRKGCATAPPLSALPPPLGGHT